MINHISARQPLLLCLDVFAVLLRVVRMQRECLFSRLFTCAFHLKGISTIKKEDQMH